MPRVSVLMTVFNGERYVREAVESILNQTFGDMEVIIVDDGSTDETGRILDAISDSRIRRFRNATNQGLTRTLNIGLDQCRGAYIARQDADDVSLPTRLERQVVFLEQNPRVVLLSSNCGWLENDRPVPGRQSDRPMTDAAIRWVMLLGNAFSHSALTMRRETLVEHDLRFDETMICAQDYDLWSRLIKYGLVASLQESLVLRRHHADAITFVKYAEQQACADRIVLANVCAAGLPEATLEDVHLMRQPAGNVYGRDRWRRIELLARLYQVAFSSSGGRTSCEPRELKNLRRAFKKDLLKAALWPPKHKEAFTAWREVAKMHIFQ